MCELQRQMGSLEFAMWPVWLEMRREWREKPAEPANYRDPKQMYEDLKATLLTFGQVTNGR